MADTRRSEKDIKKDQHVVRDVLEEVAEEIRPGATKPRVQDVNRDRALGDWDRTGDHHDEEPERPGEGEEGEET
jgi:hypothetical protein